MPPARIALALLLTAGVAAAQTLTTKKPAKATADNSPAIGLVLDRQLANLEREFVAAAEALPEDKFNFAPTNGEFKGVKTFAQQVRHVASANYEFGAGIVGEKAPADLVGGENGPEALKTKAEIVKYLKESFVYVHKAFASIQNANATASIPAPWGKGTTSRLGLANLTIAHGFDHYGQMAVYLRMNGIIPPASRPQ
jgi:uncharacterized damage-inducible protein DinB